MAKGYCRDAVPLLLADGGAMMLMLGSLYHTVGEVGGVPCPAFLASAVGWRLCRAVGGLHPAALIAVGHGVGCGDAVASVGKAGIGCARRPPEE